MRTKSKISFLTKTKTNNRIKTLAEIVEESLLEFAVKIDCLIAFKLNINVFNPEQTEEVPQNNAYS